MKTAKYFDRSRRRAAAYIVVMGTAMTAMVVGLAALMAVRVQHRAGESTKERIEARAYALSAIEMGFYIIRTEPNWREEFGTGTWSAEQPIGNGLYYLFATVDNSDGDEDPANDPAVLTGVGVCGRARHALEVKVVPLSGGMAVEEGSWKQVSIPVGIDDLSPTKPDIPMD
jgi:hypothetical protein